VSSKRPDTHEDVRQDREEFVRSFLHKSAELTEELLRDNQQLELQLTEQREENAKLRAQLASDDAVRELLQKNDDLERERRMLLARASELSANEQRQAELERDLNDMASLNVASFQLSNTLSLVRVVKHMCELMEQLVGAQSFVLYLVTADGKRGIPVGAQGRIPAALAPIPLEDGPIADVTLTGVARVLDPAEVRGTSDPIAVLPLQYASQVVGVFAVYELLPHKQTWVKVDHELIRLLSVHGATALIAANLYAKQAGPRAALQDVLLNLETERHKQLVAAETDAGGEV
jgi:hypothetical protein